MNKKEEDWTVEDFLELETKRQLNRMVNIGLFIKLTLHHTSVEFLVGSHPCCESFVSKYARFSRFLKVTKFYRRFYGGCTIQTSVKSHYVADAYLISFLCITLKLATFIDFKAFFPAVLIHVDFR